MNFVKTLKKTLYTGLKLAKKYGPQILAGASAVGAVTTTVLAVKGTVQAVHAIDEELEEQGVDKLPPKETLKIVYKYYIPTAISLVTTVGCGIASCVSSSRRTAALATAYRIAETAREEYMEATKEVVGKAKAEEIDSKAAEKRITRDEYNLVENAELTRYGQTLFKDSITGRYFRSSIDAVKAQFAEFNQDLINSDYLELNALYYKFEIDSDTEVGEYLGWNASKGLVKWHFTDGHHKLTGEPCLVINYDGLPYYAFERMRW